jgi:NhaA family Na+:H+ antiporter
MEPTTDDTRLAVPVHDTDHVRGPQSAAVTLVEYGEFECPHCGRTFHVINKLRDEFGDQLRFVFRHYPLDSEHPFSVRGSLAAEAAAAQDKFWAMHDRLFTHQHSLGYDDLRTHSEALGLDTDRLEIDVRRQSRLDRIEADFDSGVRSGVRGTPTFFVNGLKHNGSIDERGLRTAIEAALADGANSARFAV